MMNLFKTENNIKYLYRKFGVEKEIQLNSVYNENI